MQNLALRFLSWKIIKCGRNTYTFISWQLDLKKTTRLKKGEAFLQQTNLAEDMLKETKPYEEIILNYVNGTTVNILKCFYFLRASYALLATIYPSDGDGKPGDPLFAL